MLGKGVLVACALDEHWPAQFAVIRSSQGRMLRMTELASSVDDAASDEFEQPKTGRRPVSTDAFGALQRLKEEVR